MLYVFDTSDSVLVVGERAATTLPRLVFGRSLIYVKRLHLQNPATLQFGEVTQEAESLNVLAWSVLATFKEAVKSIFALKASNSVVHTRLALPYGASLADLPFSPSVGDSSSVRLNRSHRSRCSSTP